jgi:HD-like signal output (HDOD) protein
MKQMENQEWLMPVRPQLARIWRRSNAVAATAYAMAEFVDGLRADESLAAGLFHQLGNLYLLTHAHKHGLDVASNPEWNEIISGWHPVIARAILDNWGMSKKIAEAVENQDVLYAIDNVDVPSLSLLTRLLSACKLSDMLANEVDAVEPGWESKLADIRLSGELFTDLLERAGDQIASLAKSI